MDIDVRRLRMVHAIAEAGSVTKAAGRLGLSQPALTRQLQRIEQALDGPLFLRHRDGVTPTALGDLVITRARTVLITLDSLAADAARLTNDRAGLRVIRIGGTPGPLLPALVPRLRTLLPGVEISATARDVAPLLIELLTSARLEIAIVGELAGFELPRLAEIEWHTVAEEPLFVMLPRTHRFLPYEKIELADLASEPWVLPPPGELHLREAFLNACQQAGFIPHIRHEVCAREARQLIALGEGVGLSQATTYDTEVVRRPLTDTPIRLRHLLAIARNGPVSSYGRELRALADEAYDEAANRSPVYTAWRATHP